VCLRSVERNPLAYKVLLEEQHTRLEMRQHLAQLKNLASQAFTSAMHTAIANAGASRKGVNGFLRVSR
jgi:hypothetical protein